MQANATAAAPTAVSTSEAYTNLIVVIAGFISALSGVIVHYVNRPKIQAAAQLAESAADHVVESKSDISTLAKVTYSMLPEQAQKIADAPTVRIGELEAKLEAATHELEGLKQGAAKAKGSAASTEPATLARAAEHEPRVSK